jgi:hypothetical protein
VARVGSGGEHMWHGSGFESSVSRERGKGVWATFFFVKSDGGKLR